MLILPAGRDPLRTSGGNESYVVAHAKTAILAGYEPHVFSITHGRREVIETDFGFLHRVWSPAHPIRSIVAILHRPWLARAIADCAIDRPGPHLIHSYGAWSDNGVAAVRALRRRGAAAIHVATAFVATPHEAAAKLESEVVSASRGWRLVHQLELAWVRRVTAPSERRALLASSVVIVNYDSVTRMLADHYGPGMKTRRLSYVAPTAFAGRATEATGELALAGHLDALRNRQSPLIVSVSRHDGRKGLDVLIDALTELRRRGVAFRACLVGPGVLLTAHRRRVAALGLGDTVAVTGRVPDVAPFLRESDVYVLPSREEGSGSVAVLEALQAGAAIVASDVDGIPEDLTDGDNAVLVPPGDAVALADALTRVLDDAALRARMRRRARETYEARFTPAIVAEQLSALYSELGLAPTEPSTARLARIDSAT